MPGYDSDVIMAAGAFVQGSSIELSADGPIKEPYTVYFQGGLTWAHAKLGILMSLQKLYEKGIVKEKKKKKKSHHHRRRSSWQYGCTYGGAERRRCTASGTE